MKLLSHEEVEQRFGLSSEQIDQLERDATSGILHGEPEGEIVRGRPFLFGEEMRQVGFKEPLFKVEAIDRRAEQLGMRRSEYLRLLVDEDLGRATQASNRHSEDNAGSTITKTLKGKRAASFLERWRDRAILRLDENGSEKRQSGTRGGRNAHTA